MSEKKQYAPGVKKQVEEEEEVKSSEGVGLFGESTPIEPEVDQKADDQIRDFERAMTSPKVDVCGFPIRQVTLSSFALLRQINSAFLTFVPLLSEEDRVEYQQLVEKSGKSPDELQRLTVLTAMAKTEAEMLPNPFMETLKFMALMTADLTEEEAEELAFDSDPKVMRRAALAFGDRVDPSLIDEMSGAIGTELAKAQGSKVVPKKKGARNTKSKSATRRRGLHK